MITNYWYDHAIKKYLLQFCAVFEGLRYKTGVGKDGTPAELIEVPIIIGSKDRVVAALNNGNTQNKIMSLPIMAATITNIELAPERRKGISVIDRKVTLRSGGVYPDDLAVVERIMPIPYNLSLELAIYVSNTDQLWQCLEQILLMFDPILQIQTTDAAFDWTKITTVELTGINNEENYPAGTDRRMIIWSLNFVLPIYLSAPMDVKDNVVKSIKVRIGDMQNKGGAVMEVDQEGNVSLSKEQLAAVNVGV